MTIFLSFSLHQKKNEVTERSPYYEGLYKRITNNLPNGNDSKNRGFLSMALQELYN